MRISGHASTAKFESKNAPDVILPDVKVGDRVFIKSDKLKNKARDTFIVLAAVPTRKEIEVQKIHDHRQNKQNFLTVKLQNVYKPSTRHVEWNPANLSNSEAIASDEKPIPDFIIRHPKRRLVDEVTIPPDPCSCFFCLKMQKVKNFAQ